MSQCGDTITVLDSKKQQVKVRLEGIDAPESSQDFGTKSKAALGAVIAGKSVIVTISGKDKYGRFLGVVTLDGVNVNLKQVQDGWAWHFTRYSQDKSLASAEMDARQARLGLWADSHPVPPWEFRDRKRSDKSAMTAETGPDKPEKTSNLTCWLNTNTNVRHNSGKPVQRQMKCAG